MKKFISLLLFSLICFSLSCYSFAASKAYPWVQSKDNWCWATVAKAQINTRVGSVDVPSTYVKYDSQKGIRTAYCLYSNGKYIPDRAQEYIVRTYKTGTAFDDLALEDNLPGSCSEIANAVESMTGYSVSYYGTWKTLPFSNSSTRQTYIDNKLVTDSKEICGNLYDRSDNASNARGHSLLITQKTSNGNYKTWNPWTNSYTTYTADKLFNSGLYATPFASVAMYCESVVYFD